MQAPKNRRADLCNLLQAIEGAHGLAIFTVVRTGFLISGAGGSGIVVAKRDDGCGPSRSSPLLSQPLIDLFHQLGLLLPAFYFTRLGEAC